MSWFHAPLANTCVYIGSAIRQDRECCCVFQAQNPLLGNIFPFFLIFMTFISFNSLVCIYASYSWSVTYHFFPSVNERRTAVLMVHIGKIERMWSEKFPIIETRGEIYVFVFWKHCVCMQTCFMPLIFLSFLQVFTSSYRRKNSSIF